MLKVKIKRIDKSLPLPTYETNGSVGFDLVTRENTVIQPHEIALVPGNVVVEVPEDHMLVVASRSSTPRKTGLTMPHGIGIIDHDYCGPTDEIMAQVYNFRNDPITIEKGTRIAQGIFVRISKAEWIEVDEVESESRGGFGSTG